MTDHKFRVLIVCTANLCRSPMAEYVLRDAVARRWGSHSAWTIGSAGVHAQSGMEMHPRARRVLERRGLDPAGFRSRQLSHRAIEEADLILTAERAHRAAIVTLMPAAVHRTFTLRQFARMAAVVTPLDAEPDPTMMGQQLVTAAINARSRLQPLAAGEEDVPDPIGHRGRRFRRCADELSRLISTVMAPLGEPG